MGERSRLAMFLTLFAVGLIISAALTASLWSLLGVAPVEKAAAGRYSRPVESTLAFPDEGGQCGSDGRLVCPRTALKPPDENTIFKGTY